MPKDKNDVVRVLQALNYVVGMTGDGVNDAPALKQAHIGIAVEGSTDAARNAADIVLTTEGLAPIFTAVLESRKIFQRVYSYARPAPENPFFSREKSDFSRRLAEIIRVAAAAPPRRFIRAAAPYSSEDDLHRRPLAGTCSTASPRRSRSSSCCRC